MILQISRHITRSLVQNSIINFDDFSIYQYGLEVLLITLFETLGILIVAIMTGYVIEALVFITAFCSIRAYAGGYHAKTVTTCFLSFLGLGGITVIFAKLLQMASLPWLSVLIASIAFLVIYKFAPVAVSNRPITESERRKFRSISIQLTLVYLVAVIALVVAQKYLWYVGVFSMGLLLEALTLLVEKYREEYGL